VPKGPVCRLIGAENIRAYAGLYHKAGIGAETKVLSGAYPSGGRIDLPFPRILKISKKLP
jgi:hypothetical protein